MEGGLLVVLAVVGSLIYKLYQNYQEEMEKARKRQQQMRPPSSTPTPTYVEPKRPTPEPVVVIHRPQPVERKPVPTPVITQEPKYKPELPEEVIRLQRERQERETKRQRKKIQTLALAEEEIEKKAAVQFDLRQAVIQAAILERPYQ